jgi:hypothetical protein
LKSDKRAKSKSRLYGDLTTNFARWLCAFLHISMLAIHAALLIGFKRHWEHGVVFSLGQSNGASTGITIFLQAFGTVRFVTSMVSFFLLAHRFIPP